MDKKKWKIIEDFVLNDGRFNSDDFEEFLETINEKSLVIKNEYGILFR